MLIVPLIALQIVIFAVLIFFFRRIMTQNVVVATKHLEEMNRDYAEKEKKVTRELEEARTKSQEIVSKAQEEAEKLKMEIIKHSEEERDTVIKQARTTSEAIIQQADKSRQQLLGEIDERIAKESIKKACELIQETLPEQLKQIVHTHWVDELIENGFKQAGKLNISEDTHEIRILSAFALNEEQNKRLSRVIKEAVGRPVTVQVVIDPKLVAGLVISIGSLVLDGSLKNKIQEKAK